MHTSKQHTLRLHGTTTIDIPLHRRPHSIHVGLPAILTDNATPHQRHPPGNMLVSALLTMSNTQSPRFVLLPFWAENTRAVAPPVCPPLRRYECRWGRFAHDCGAQNTAGRPPPPPPLLSSTLVKTKKRSTIYNTDRLPGRRSHTREGRRHRHPSTSPPRRSGRCSPLVQWWESAVDSSYSGASCAAPRRHVGSGQESLPLKNRDTCGGSHGGKYATVSQTYPVMHVQGNGPVYRDGRWRSRGKAKAWSRSLSCGAHTGTQVSKNINNRLTLFSLHLLVRRERP